MRGDARLLLVDDNPAVLRQVVQILPSEFEIAGSLVDGAGLQHALDAHQPDILILDITLPGLSGIALASQLRATGSTAKIVFLTMHSDPDYVRAALDVGAAAYIVKSRLSLDLVPALRAVLHGELFISPTSELDATTGST